MPREANELMYQLSKDMQWLINEQGFSQPKTKRQVMKAKGTFWWKLLGNC